MLREEALVHTTTQGSLETATKDRLLNRRPGEANAQRQEEMGGRLGGGGEQWAWLAADGYGVPPWVLKMFFIRGVSAQLCEYTNNRVHFEWVVFWYVTYT